MRSPSKGKVVGSIPAGALALFLFLSFFLFILYILCWSRGAMETRLPPKQKIVGSTPAEIVVDCIFGVVNIKIVIRYKKDIRSHI